MLLEEINPRRIDLAHGIATLLLDVQHMSNKLICETFTMCDWMRTNVHRTNTFIDVGRTLMYQITMPMVQSIPIGDERLDAVELVQRVAERTAAKLASEQAARFGCTTQVKFQFTAEENTKRNEINLSIPTIWVNVHVPETVPMTVDQLTQAHQAVGHLCELELMHSRG